jgi:hypothetical protein
MERSRDATVSTGGYKETTRSVGQVMTKTPANVKPTSQTKMAPKLLQLAYWSFTKQSSWSF